MITELTASNFEEVISREGIVLVDCWASWCRNCDDFGEAYSEAAQKHPSHTFASLDTQRQRELRLALDIRHVPALLVYRDGLLLFKQPGSFDVQALHEIVAQAESVDMEEVRAALAARPESTAA